MRPGVTRSGLLGVSLLLFACASEDPVDARDPIEAQIDLLLEQMTLEEKVAEKSGLSLFGVDDLYPAGGVERLGIPPFQMVDGPRGVRAGTATAFPVGIARGATWDVELERRVGRAIGLEARAKGANVILAPVVNVLRHPGWGRAQETYGEDSYHLGAMGAAFVEGAQENVLASVKHFALNSIEDSRFDVDVQVDERALREVYLPHFKTVVDAGVASVMSAYNKVNGRYCAENEHLLSNILKGEWGFDGFVESDWVLGTRSTVESANAGLDIEMPFGSFFGEDLLKAVRSGHVKEATIDDSVRRILRKKLQIPDGPRPDSSVVESDAHRALAREIAERSIVLLQNRDALLPLDRAARVAVLGPLAKTANLGDLGSSAVTPSTSVSPLEGLMAAGDATYVASATSAELASDFDVAVVVVGLSAKDEGENIPGQNVGDRTTLALSDEDRALIRAAAAALPTVVVLEGGSAITMDWIDAPKAVLMAWYPGMEGGHAIASIVYGDVNPSGRLPLAFPKRDEDCVAFDPTAKSAQYTLFHGQRHLDQGGIEALFPFGHGLSYTSFEYSALEIDGRTVRVSVKNTGARSGTEIVQLYVAVEGSATERPVRSLAGFEAVPLEPGETRRVELTVSDQSLAYYDVDRSAWVVEAIPVRVEVGDLSATLTPR